MTQDTLCIERKNAKRFRYYLWIATAIFIPLILLMSFFLGMQNLNLLLWIAFYALMSVIMSYIAVISPTFAKRTLITLPSLAILLLLITTANNVKLEYAFYFIAVTYTVSIAYIAIFTLDIKPYRSSVKTTNHTCNHNSHAIRRRAIRRANTRARFKNRLKVSGYRS